MAKPRPAFCGDVIGRCELLKDSYKDGKRVFVDVRCVDCGESKEHISLGFLRSSEKRIGVRAGFRCECWKRAVSLRRQRTRPPNEQGLRWCSTHEDYVPIEQFGKDVSASGGIAYSCLTCSNEKNRKHAKENYLGTALSRARQRAKEASVPFSLTKDQMPLAPDVCPVLGIELQKCDGKATGNSPSLDRIIPSLGYVPGNVHWISQRANQIKNDATVRELRLIADYFEKLEVAA
jgi:hypothetical protein